MSKLIPTLSPAPKPEPRQILLVEVRTLDDIYDQLTRQLPFPEHFGRNLDALYDVLTGELEGPLAIVWHDAPHALELLGEEDFEAVLDVLNDAADERGDLDIVIGASA
ncbi:barstar family protein [Andreprevotia chitinilytica]|uniref:barstar family protein n=1 Tax=Andreprevotia chitinilytica TaxID=396808 RepID=UPI0006896739|nr:barstar family protein [Andreprevotia chitinilytica]